MKVPNLHAIFPTILLTLSSLLCSCALEPEVTPTEGNSNTLGFESLVPLHEPISNYPVSLESLVSHTVSDLASLRVNVFRVSNPEGEPLHYLVLDVYSQVEGKTSITVRNAQEIDFPTGSGLFTKCQIDGKTIPFLVAIGSFPEDPNRNQITKISSAYRINDAVYELEKYEELSGMTCDRPDFGVY